jgi:dihydropteroate synthase
MGILNVTPDSFSDGGRFDCVEAALVQARRMLDDGAVIIDVGGESTRPGAADVDVDVEIGRVVPVIEALCHESRALVSIDTSKPEVMAAAVGAGAGMVNDVRALREPGALAMAARLDVPVCLMHMQGQPRSMQEAPEYDDVVSDVLNFLEERIAACGQAGIDRSMLVVDPGFGFGKTVAHNLSLLSRLDEFGRLGLPVMVGISRKSTLGALTGRDVDDRLAASVAAATLACLNGADILRVHDVAETRDALRVTVAVRDSEQPGGN